VPAAAWNCAGTPFPGPVEGWLTCSQQSAAAPIAARPYRCGFSAVIRTYALLIAVLAPAVLSAIHLAVDGRGRPLSVLFTAGQAGDNAQLFALLDAIRVHDGGPGRPRKKRDMLIAD
jgi:hypothetical protein